MLDGTGLPILWKGRSGTLAVPFRILSFALVLLFAGKMVRDGILKHENVRYYTKHALPNRKAGKLVADDLDLAIAWNEDAQKFAARGLKTKELREHAERSVLFAFAKWLEQKAEDDQEYYASTPRKVKMLVKELKAPEFKTRDGWKHEREIFVEPYSLPPESYGLMSWGSIILVAIFERLDDGLFINALGCWLLCIAGGGAFARAKQIAPDLAIRLSGKQIACATALGVLLFGSLQGEMFAGECGPLHGWFATRWWRPAVALTQWLDGVLGLTICLVAGRLFCLFSNALNAVLRREGLMMTDANYRRAAADLVSAPVVVLRTLVIFLFWLFAAEFLRRYGQHFHVPGASTMVLGNSAFLSLSFLACIRRLPPGFEWSISTKGFSLGLPKGAEPA
jgi:hypothetical protein